ncbi:MAG: metallophosphoesterase [Rhodobacteraceae bacterium]|nr:metallophosphoesterase [Paracoccaceae bacterium]
MGRRDSISDRLLEIAVAGGGLMFKFVVVSDLHFVPDGMLSHSIDTVERFREAVIHINEFNRDAEFCIVAGDLADQGETAAYERLSLELEKLQIPFFLVVGNHDSHENFAGVFGDLTNSETGFMDRCIDVHGQRIIILDSVMVGEHAGWLGEAQLSWLKGRLDGAANMPVIVVLHHNITDLMVSNDEIRLRNNGPLLDVLSGHPDIRHVISGHVHLTSSGTCSGIPFTTISGCHYNIAPRRHDKEPRSPRFDGPGQYAVVWSGKDATVVLAEDFSHRQVHLPIELFR